MSDSELRATTWTVGDLFDGSATTYTVPAYQRNYAWRAEHIEQMLSDLQDAHEKDENYFLGNLVVTRRGPRQPDYEIVDGQQRLTTLHLLLTALRLVGSSAPAAHEAQLRYQSRTRATAALRRLAADSRLEVGRTAEPSDEDGGILQGYNVVQQYLDQYVARRHRATFAEFLRARVYLVRTELPDGTDLNRYFEVMNTRGQQLQQVDIIKARLMSQLDGDSARTDRAAFSQVWDACADMASYVQMSLARGNTTLRTRLFGSEWSWLRASTFDEVAGALQELDQTGDGYRGAWGSSRSLSEALHANAALGARKVGEGRDKVGFRSTITFSSLLLHVLSIMEGAQEEDERSLEDKHLIHRFETAFRRQRDQGQRVKELALLLLQCRNLFDAFVLKRQYTPTNGEDGDWSLQRLVRRSSGGRSTAGYRNTYAPDSDVTEEDGPEDAATEQLLLIQSMLRVTYTSPRSMHWITRLLRILRARGHGVPVQHLVDELRDYARGKVVEACLGPEEPTGFGIGRIVFTYLDYLLLLESPRPSFRFAFRNSIEHFYPQQVDPQQSGSTVSPEHLHLLGNLALVSVGTNSKFSNSLPRAKAENYRSTIERQSPKLQEMARITRESDGWGDAEVMAHHERMMDLLRRDGARSRPVP